MPVLEIEIPETVKIARQDPGNIDYEIAGAVRAYENLMPLINSLFADFKENPAALRRLGYELSCDPAGPTPRLIRKRQGQ